MYKVTKGKKILDINLRMFVTENKHESLIRLEHGIIIQGHCSCSFTFTLCRCGNGRSIEILQCKKWQERYRRIDSEKIMMRSSWTYFRRSIVEVEAIGVVVEL